MQIKRAKVIKAEKDSHLYSVYDLDDELIICGTVEQICNRLDITKSCVSKAYKNQTLVRRRYHIYKV